MIMKKLFSLLLCFSALFAGNVVAQDKGDMYFGGSLGLGVTAVGDGGYSASAVTFSLAPEFSYFVADNFRVGAEVALGIADGVTTFAVTPTVAYYVRLVDKLYYTPEFNIGGGFAASDGYTTGLFTLGLDLFALEFMPTSKIGLSLSLVNLQYNLLSEASVSTFHFGLLTSPEVGFRYYF